MPNAWSDAAAWFRYHYGDAAEEEMKKLYGQVPAPDENLVQPPDTPAPPPPPPPVQGTPTTPHYAQQLSGGAGPYVAPAPPPPTRPPTPSAPEPAPGGVVPPTLPSVLQVSRSSGPRADLPNADRQPTTAFGISTNRGLGVNPNRPVAEREPLQAQQLFNPDDPETAVYNALRDLGVDPYKSQHPVAAELLQNAKGITDAYYIDLALSGKEHTPQQFAQFLRSTLAGGTVPKTQLKRAAESLPRLVPQIRDIMARMEGRGNADLPYENTALTTLATMLSDPSGGALAAMLSRLMGPSIPTSAGRTAYNRQLAAAMANAQRAQADRGTTEQLGSLNDFWTYLLGAGRAPSYL